MTRPRGRPPMPSAMARPSEPVEIASTSMLWSLAPRRMTEPLPCIFSIWESAASSAFILSIAPPSTHFIPAGSTCRSPIWQAPDVLNFDSNVHFLFFCVECAKEPAQSNGGVYHRANYDTHQRH